MPRKSIPGIAVSALRGGSGKTILSLCLIAVWRKKGLKVIPFKKGPDYIDAGWLAHAAHHPCFNLDLFMMPPERIQNSFISHSKGADVVLIEGNRGLYDGVDHQGTYSTAQLAKLLKTPVLLIVDCTKATNTIAAVVLGCQKMDPKVPIGGVVLNNIATGRQESLIRKAIKAVCNLPVFGAIPRLEKDLFPERHMGLTPFHEHLAVKKSIASVKEIGSKYLDLDGIWKLAQKAGHLPGPKVHSPSLRIGRKSARVKIGILKDSAFQFYYPENLEELEKRGAKLIPISALREKKLPELDALYIGGGFPETHAIALSGNTGFRKSLRTAIEEGLPVYAECGGLIYLGKSLILKGRKHPMTGVFPLVFNLQKKPQAHGYTIIRVTKTNPFFPRNTLLKGHEFHYSNVIEINNKKNTYMAFNVQRGKGIKNSMDGICYKNVLATYTHLHALGTPEWAECLIKCAMNFRLHRSPRF